MMVLATRFCVCEKPIVPRATELLLRLLVIALLLTAFIMTGMKYLRAPLPCPEASNGALAGTPVKYLKKTIKALCQDSLPIPAILPAWPGNM